MRIVVIDGHPDAGDAESGGLEVRLFRLRDLQFDPILRGGFKMPQPLEPDLVKARDVIRWCQHFVILGRSARVIYTQNSPQWVAVLAREDLFWRNMRRAFLGNCGFHPIKRSRLDKVNDVTQAQRVAWLEGVKKLGRRGA